MATEVTLPRQGWAMDEAAFVEWLKSDGDEVRAGDPVFSVETDKAVQEIESPDAGILRIPPDGPGKGDAVHVGDVLAYLVQPGEPAPFEGAGAPAAARARPAKSDAARPALKEPAAAVSRIAAAAPSLGQEQSTRADRNARPVSPRAARRAVEDGVDLRTVQGTGQGGRIREQDVVAAARAGATGSPNPSTAFPTPPRVAGREIPLSGLRRTIAERMVRSRTVTVPVTLTTQADATALVGLRARCKAAAHSPDDPVPTYADMAMALAAAALQEHPALNARWDEDRIVLCHDINIGIAVDTEDGLLVPVVNGVPALSLRQLAAKTRDLVERARRRRLLAEELTGGTFTVTNLGGLGIDAFTPVINCPECAVLGLGRIVREPTALGDRIVLQDRIWLSLTFDHRIVDGAPAARFLDAVRRRVENPEVCRIA